MDKRLTNKQYEFCMHYIKNGFNACEAALSAGYSQSYAYSRAHELPDNPIIHQYLGEAHNKAMESLGITYEWKMQILKRIINAFMPESGEQPTTQGAKAAIQAISELNRMQGSLAPKKKLTVNIDVTRGRLAEVKRVYNEY